MIKVGSQFTGVGAFEMALKRLNIPFKNVYAAEWDKYARQTYLANFEEPQFYVEDVHDTPTDKIPQLDIAMFSPPCQAFSLAGNRKGEADKRGVLFYNSHEFIRKNKPRYFIFENVKGLLSDDKGKTFQRWIDYLGGKSVNGTGVFFPHEESVPYHVYYKVLNAKKYGIPQNRERVFIVGIRDDADNDFTWSKEILLVKRLKDVLEENVDQKYYLSDKMINGFIKHGERHKEKGTGFQFSSSDINKESRSITTRSGSRNTDNFIKEGFINQDTQASQVFSDKGTSSNICAGTHGYANGYVKVSKEVRTSASKEQRKITGTNDFRGKEIEFRDSEVMNCITSGLTKDHFIQIPSVQKDNVVIESGTWRTHKDGQGFRKIQDGNCPTIPARAREDGSGQPVIKVLNNPTHSQQRIYSPSGISPTICSGSNGGGQNPVKHLTNDYKIRRLTERECFRLMDFPDSFIMPCSGTQMYKQAGNSIVVACLESIIKKLKL